MRAAAAACSRADRCVGALSCATLALAPNAGVMFVGWLLAGVAMAACLYDPAFATLHRIAGDAYRRSVTALTLFGGFASTVFWPLSQFLLDTLGWRAAFGVYAALHLRRVPAAARVVRARQRRRGPRHRGRGDCAVRTEGRARTAHSGGSPRRSPRRRSSAPRCPRT